MDAADIPTTKFPIPFADQAGGSFIRPIPVDSQIGIDDGAASLQTGFVPVNFDPVAAGGIPPSGKDFNGILFEISAWTRWNNAGGAIPHDAAFATAMGGYPAGAVVAADTLGHYWISTVDANLTDPDAGGAGWLPFSVLEASTRIVTSSADFTILITDGFIGLQRLTSLVALQTITIPAATREGQPFTIEDLVGNLQDHPVDVFPPTGTIAGNPKWTMNQNYQSLTFRRYAGDIWSVK